MTRLTVFPRQHSGSDTQFRDALVPSPRRWLLICYTTAMEVFILIFLGVLIVVLTTLIVKIKILVKPANQSSELQDVDSASIIKVVQASIDIEAISAGVRGAVETKIHEAAQTVLTSANAQAAAAHQERATTQRELLEQQTRNLLQPFESQLDMLKGELELLRDLNQRNYGSVDKAVSGLVHQTQALNQVLSNSQKRGTWGERMLEDILSQTGMIRGINYEIQERLTEGGKPDFSFFLPPDRVLYLDSKFPLENYISYFDAAEDISRKFYLEQFLVNVQQKIEELSKRDYVGQSIRSPLDYVLLFIPNEGILGFIQQNKPRLIDEALKSRVLLCSPLNLYAFLGVVRQATDSFHMEQSSNEVLRLLHTFSKNWKNYLKQIELIQSRFDQIQDGLRKVTTGKVMTNLRRPVEDIERLVVARGLADKSEVLGSLSQSLSDDAENEELEDEES